MAKLIHSNELINRINFLSELLGREFNSEQLGLSYRQISNWANNHLIPFELAISRWHSFSFIEACWIKMVSELIDLGLPIAAIKAMTCEIAKVFDTREILKSEERVEVVKDVLSGDELSNFGDFVQSSDFDYSTKQFASTQFGLLIMQCIMTRSPLFILVSSAGNFFLVDQPSLNVPEFRDEYEHFKEKTHISISLNQIITSVLPIPIQGEQKFYNSILSKEENDLMDILRSNLDADQMNIRLKKGKYDKTIDLVELQKTEKIDPLARIAQLFLKDGYEEVSLITEKGIIKSVKRKRKIKL